MKISHVTLALAVGLCVPTAAMAQSEAQAAASPALNVGVMIFDPQGGEVGKIESVAGDNVVLDTGASKATLPKTAFGKGAKGPVVNATKAQIDTMVASANAKSAAALEAAFVPGAEVHGEAGAIVGTVKETQGENIVIDRPAGLVTLTKRAFALSPNGLTISMTAAELEAAAKAALQTSPTT